MRRCERGEKVSLTRPSVHWKTTTFIGRLASRSHHGSLCLYRPVGGEHFLAYVEQALAPTLSPGDIVIMDNLGSHKVAAFVKPSKPPGQRSAFCLLALDLDPIK